MSPVESPLLQSIGIPEIAFHNPIDHFDFTKSHRCILVVGPMGAGKTGFAAQIWRDSLVVKRKDRVREACLTPSGADLRELFFVRSRLDARRFRDYPSDALAYRGGYELLGTSIAEIDSSTELEQLIDARPEVGTWILDEASFYDGANRLRDRTVLTSTWACLCVADPDW